MILGDSSTVAQALQKLQADGKLPSGLSREQLAKLSQAIQKYSGEVSDKLLKQILDEYKSQVHTAATMAAPENARGILADLTANVGDSYVANAIRYALKITSEVSSGAGIYLSQNLTPGAVQEYPALALQRLMDREIPRGLKIAKTVKGAPQIVDDEENDWPHRWEAAGAETDDEDWLPWEGDAQGGRGVALKSSGIWQALGDGAGGYDDTLGNPFPPFAFNSGFRTINVSREEAVNLGLIGAAEEAKSAPINFKKLFAEVAA